MKLLKEAVYATVLVFVFTFSFECIAQQKGTFPVFEEQLPFEVKTVAFQEWYAGIKVGGTGINIYIPITNLDENIKIDRVYFRNLTSELNKKDDKYFAVLKNKSRDYTFKKSETPADYPFKIKDNECVVSYIENNTTKYLKIDSVNEFAGVYYENGPPSIYTNESSTAIATLDSEDDN